MWAKCSLEKPLSNVFDGNSKINCANKIRYEEVTTTAIMDQLIVKSNSKNNVEAGRIYCHANAPLHTIVLMEILKINCAKFYSQHSLNVFFNGRHEKVGLTLFHKLII